MATSTKTLKEEAAAEEGKSEHARLGVNPGQEASQRPPIRKRGLFEGSGDDGRPVSSRNKTHVPSVGTGHSDGRFRARGAGGPMKPKPVHVTQTSPTLGADSPATCFTIPPTEEDIKQMQSSQIASGYIKRPLNAFMVWVHIHRYVLQNAFHRAGVKNIRAQLGLEWSKLSEKQKQPYSDAAQKLKDISRQQFPEHLPRKRRPREDFTPEQEAVPSGSQKKEPLPFVKPMWQGPTMIPCPPVVPYMMGYNSYQCVLPCWPMGCPSGFQIHHSSLYGIYPNASSSMEERRTHHYAHLQMGQIAPASLSRETMQQADNQSSSSNNVLSGSFIPESHTQPSVITSQQQSSNGNEDSKCEEDIDVVGLF